MWSQAYKSIMIERDVTEITYDICNSLPDEYRQHIDDASDNHCTIIATVQCISVDNEEAFTSNLVEQTIRKPEQ